MWKKSLPYFEGIDSRHWFVFTYDPIGRVIATLNPDGSQTTVAYLRGTKTLVDANNHMKQEDYDGAGRLRQVREYTTGGDPYAVTQAGDDKTYLYDSNGNMTQKDSVQHTIAWNEDNKPQTITDYSQDTRFVYDYQGQRVKKIDANGSTTTYIGNYFECTDGTCTRHTFAGNGRFASHAPGESYYYHTDHLSGLYALTKGSDGTKAESVYYYPFGGTRVDNGSANLPYKFTGQELDPETKLYNFNARQYHADLGRFISPDSVVPSPGDPQTLNRYSYCRNNPQLFVDPTGHFSILSFFENLFAGFVGGATLFLTAGNAILAGMAAGAVSGAFSGDIKNVVQGAVTGGVTGGMMGGLPGPAQFAVAAGGLGYSVAKNGPDQLAYFGAGLVGGAIGYYGAGAIGGDVGPAAMGGPSSGGYRQANANVPDLMRMPEDVMNDLKPYAYDNSGKPIDLSDMMLHKGLPRWVSQDAEAFTGSAVDIYWNPDKLLYPSNYFTAIIGHEAIIHTQQYLNIPNFKMMYGFEALIHGIGPANKYEAPAYDLQWKIFRDLNMRP